MSTKKRNVTPLLQALLAVAVAAGTCVAAASTPQAPAVAEVSMVLGKAWLHAADGSKQLIRLGTRIGVADRIETASNGHVHLRFVDQALVVVRPSSLLAVERYDYDAANPSASAVKLNLREGVARSISGTAAEAAKQNFRMNTPLAAIGVRGTDFVVSASADSVHAMVKEGAIVLAPFSSECSMEALGPCSRNALELGGGTGQIAVLDASSLQPSLLPRSDADIPAALQRSVQAMVADNDSEAASAAPEKDDRKDIYTDSVAALAVNRKLTDSSRPPVPAPTPEPVPTPVEYTPDVALSTQELTTNTQLVWGRWFERNLADERISVPYSTAVQGGREVTVGVGNYVLFRLEQGTKDVSIKPGLGDMAFSLNQAQAFLSNGSTRELMEVYGGLLNINFDQRVFSTSLVLNHAVTGRIEYRDSGRVFDGGTFRNRSDDQVTAGVLSIDGKEAGYYFETQVPAGAIQGLTLWSQQPQ